MIDFFCLNGALSDAEHCSIPVADRSYLLGDGLFETMLVKNGQAVYLREHLQRLTDSSACFGYSAPAADTLANSVCNVIEANRLDTAALRLTLSPYESRGVLAAPGSRLNVLITFRRGEPYSPALYERGFTAVIAATRRNELSPASRHKTTSFIDSVLARQEAQSRGADEAILLNTRGRIAEGSVTNIFLVANGEVLTPRIEEGALPGIIRAKVLAACNDFSIPAREESLAAHDIEQAEEAFLTNSLLGIMPLVKIESIELASTSSHSITSKLRQVLPRG